MHDAWCAWRVLHGAYAWCMVHAAWRVLHGAWCAWRVLHGTWCILSSAPAFGGIQSSVCGLEQVAWLAAHQRLGVRLAIDLSVVRAAPSIHARLHSPRAGTVTSCIATLVQTSRSLHSPHFTLLPSHPCSPLPAQPMLLCRHPSSAMFPPWRRSRTWINTIGVETNTQPGWASRRAHHTSALPGRSRARTASGAAATPTSPSPSLSSPLPAAPELSCAASEAAGAAEAVPGGLSRAPSLCSRSTVVLPQYSFTSRPDDCNTRACCAVGQQNSNAQRSVAFRSACSDGFGGDYRHSDAFGGTKTRIDAFRGGDRHLDAFGGPETHVDALRGG
eukprot:365453-Chlamydomonas_euryale.AAC.6